MEKRPPDRRESGGSKALISKTNYPHHAKTALERNNASPRQYWLSAIIDSNEPVGGSIPFGLRRNATPFAGK